MNDSIKKENADLLENIISSGDMGENRSRKHLPGGKTSAVTPLLTYSMLLRYTHLIFPVIN